MKKNDIITECMSRFTQCFDELGEVGVNVLEDDLVSLAILGLSKSWHSYQDSVNEREKLMNWERLWFDLVQEEIRQNTRDRTSYKGKDEENCALVGKEKKGKVKKSQSKPESSQGGKKKDLSRIKCFNCHEFMHYPTKY